MAFFICRILRKNTGKHLLHKCNFSKLLVGTTNLICRLTYRYANRASSEVNRKVRNEIKRKERRESGLCVPLRKNFAHFAVKKISLFRLRSNLVNRKVRNGITRKEPRLFDMLGSAHVERMIMEVL